MLFFIGLLVGIVSSSIVWYLVLRNNRKRVQNWLNLPEDIRDKAKEIKL